MAIDGTKIQANASRHKAMSQERMQQSETQLKAQINAQLEHAKTTDAAKADEPMNRIGHSGQARAPRGSPSGHQGRARTT